jgi:tetratricopeptide (TPR) repeat protein
MLGDLFMEIDRPDAAIPCYQDFLKSHRAGAKTYLKIGLAWEKLGEKAKAIKAFKQVTAYDGNPLSSEAYDALHRLGA